jgi:hypothetical protein
MEGKSSPKSVVMVHLIVPVPAMLSPLLMPFRTLFVVGSSERKSDLMLEIQLEAPVSMHIGQPPGEKFMILVDDECKDCHALMETDQKTNGSSVLDKFR